MTEQQAGWIKGLVGPLRVKPGSKVNLPRDFDPGARFGVQSKDDGQELLRQGVELLAEYQDRLAAQDTHGVLVVLQALDAGGQRQHDPARDERGEPAGRHGVQLQGALRRGTRPRLPVAARPATARTRARSASSTGRTTRRCSSSASTRRTLEPRELPPGSAHGTSGNAATGRSTTGSAT